MNSTKIAAALRALADAFEDPGIPGAPVIPAGTATEPPPAAPAPRGRGRPPKAVEAPAVAQAAAAAEPDPFAAPAVQELPAATLQQVRDALTALKEASSQALAVGVLKSAGGADNLSGLAADKYAVVVAAARAAMPAKSTTPVEVDPFETTAPEPAKEAAKEPTLEEVRAAVVAAQKKTGVDTVQKVVMDHGGKVAKDGGGYGPSLKAIPVTQYAALIAAVQNLPTTK